MERNKQKKKLQLNIFWSYSLYKMSCLLWAECFLPKFTYWRPSPQYLRTCLEMGSLMKELRLNEIFGVGPNPTWRLYLWEEIWTRSHTHCGKCMWRPVEKMAMEKPKGEDFRSNQPSWHIDLGLLAHKTKRKPLASHALPSCTSVSQSLLIRTPIILV